MATPEITIDRSLIQTEEDMLARWGEFDKPLVSINCITYNHEKYISDALDGFLIQKTDFPFEILVHDDASTDETADIIREYEKRYPNTIKPIYQTVNQHSQGVKPSHKFNFPRTQGKYIACCEGDDYWTDPYKLQKQIDLLEVNPGYGMVHTDASILFEEKKVVISSNNKRLKRFPDSGYIFEKLLQSNTIMTATVLVRSEVLSNALNSIGSSLNKWKMGDYPLWLEISKHSKIKYLNEVTSVYRSSRNTASRREDKNESFLFIDSIFQIQFYFAEKYNLSEDIILKINRKYKKHLLSAAASLGDFSILDRTEFSSYSPESFKEKLILFVLKNRKYEKILFQTIKTKNKLGLRAFQ